MVVDQMAVDLFAELGNWLANVSSPVEETSSRFVTPPVFHPLENPLELAKEFHNNYDPPGSEMKKFVSYVFNISSTTQTVLYVERWDRYQLITKFKRDCDFFMGQGDVSGYLQTEVITRIRGRRRVNGWDLPIGVSSVPISRWTANSYVIEFLLRRAYWVRHRSNFLGRPHDVITIKDKHHNASAATVFLYWCIWLHSYLPVAFGYPYLVGRVKVHLTVTRVTELDRAYPMDASTGFTNNQLIVFSGSVFLPHLNRVRLRFCLVKTEKLNTVNILCMIVQV
ncbi:hypothetical protein CLF_101670 [Clonorchis sinensis]|uniref:Uncharacterized protein n=1 Tax=Clonorchis sinensis TaxID=79923 RepID=G7Y6A1_CLOSI|nr:hypothetical protein CLF_101670 [Clonorchis sinensis]